MAPEFVHLHVHSDYSLLDGCCSPRALPAEASALGMKALALTDHGVLHGAIQFYRASLDVGIKPLIGCELYVAPGSRGERNERRGRKETTAYHLTVLAENDVGYRNLCLLSSKGFLEGYYYRPRVDRELLQAHKEGLIVLSGCLAGEVPALLMAGAYDGACEAATWYRETFSSDNYYLELMDHGLDEQKSVNEGLIRLHRELQIPLVATNDVHYLTHKDAAVQDVLLCVQTGKRLDDTSRMKFVSDRLYLKSPEEMSASFADTAGALSNTVAIAERCRVTLDFNGARLPKFDVGDHTDVESVLREKVYQGAGERYGSSLSQAVTDRVEHELGVILSTGYADYFLIVWDLIRAARSKGIAVGPGRGSSASSLVAYALRITDVDPLVHGLVFERFLNPERVTMPDIDMDFCYERRHEVLEYAVRRYGKERVAQICTFGTLAARAAVRDVGRVLGLPYGDVDRVAKMIPAGPGVTLQNALEERPELRGEQDKDERIHRLMETSLKVEGKPRHLSVHAAGIVIAPDALAHSVPVCKTSEGAVVSQFSGEDLEALGYLKMDLLGLRTLTVLAKATELIEETRRVAIDLAALPLDDSTVYERLSCGEAEGVFQLETSMFKNLLKEMRPRHFEDLVAVLSLGRPGPMARLDDYMRRRRGETKTRYPHPALREILDETCGIMLYQEQVMKIATVLAGYSPGQADLLRRAMGKKKPEIMQEERARFTERSVAHGLELKVAQAIFDDMAKFAEYGFPKSHSVAYALVAYQTAYLKVHYPAEFLAAQLSSVMSASGRVGRYLQECRRQKVPVEGPDVNESGIDFSVRNGAIRFGLAAVKHVGKALAERIVACRAETPYRSLDHFCEKLAGPSLNKKGLESLVRSGAFDGTGITRIQGVARLDLALQQGERARLQKAGGQVTLFVADAPVDSLAMEEDELSLEERLADEVELLGAYLSAHPLDPYREVLAGYAIPAATDGRTCTVGGVVVAVKTTAVRTGGMMAFVTIEDTLGSQCEVVIFPRLYRQGLPVTLGSVLTVRGRVEIDEDVVKILAETCRPVAGEPVEIAVGDEAALERLRSALSKHPGYRPVVLTLVGRRTAVRLVVSPRFWVDHDAFDVSRLQQVEGVSVKRP